MLFLSRFYPDDWCTKKQASHVGPSLAEPSLTSWNQACCGNTCCLWVELISLSLPVGPIRKTNNKYVSSFFSHEWIISGNGGNLNFLDSVSSTPKNAKVPGWLQLHQKVNFVFQMSIRLFADSSRPNAGIFWSPCSMASSPTWSLPPLPTRPKAVCSSPSSGSEPTFR